MMGRWCLTAVLRCAGTLALCAALLTTVACGATTSARTAPSPTPSPTSSLPTPTPTPVPMTIMLTSSAFKSGSPIPSQYTCDGANTSPPLAWSAVPPQTVSYVLLMDDISGGGFTHWVLFNIPASTRALPANVPPGGQLPDGARQGTDDAGVVGYYGPCPALPKGATDTYVFTLYALDAELNLDPGIKEFDVLGAARRHILAGGQTSGTYMVQNS